MHRTGTSAVARLLHRHGLWLGDEADMMAANPYNPDGYFENVRLVEVNNSILELFGGTWSCPPRLSAGWTEDPRLEDARGVAQMIAETMSAGHEVWGFKDPRAALTLPFWRSVWGDLTVIVTLRNPLEAARSLHRRDGMTIDQGIALWSVHYRSILEHTAPADRIVVGFESMCADPVGGARALLSRLAGLREVDPDAARASVRPELRHHRDTIAGLQATEAPGDVLELYARLQDETVNADAYTTDSAAISALDLAIRDVHVEVQRLAAAVARIENEIGFARSADLAGIAAHLEYQRGLVERIAQALPHAIESVTAANGRSE